MDNYFQEIRDAVVNRKKDQIEELVKGAIESGVDVDQIINDGLIVAMEVIGQKYTDGQIYIPEMLASAITMKKGLEAIKPFLKAQAIKSKGIILVGTVQGDIHDIGKNIVIMMLEGGGFQVVDLGVDVKKDKIVQQIEEIKPDLLGLSALLTTTMPGMKAVIDALEEKGLRKKIKVMVGGAPVDALFAKKIGADGYGANAVEAVRLAKELIGGNE
jgi:5-methyltetrahydrofolate--homocysteine methyltransferase